MTATHQTTTASPLAAAADAPTAKSLILDLLATLRGDAAMPVRALIEAGGLFGIASNNVRVSLARLLRAGQIARDERGRYRLGPRAAAIGRHIASWRHAEEQRSAWAGDFWGVLRPRGRGASRAALRQEERALELLGLRALEAELWIRPANLALTLDAFQEQLASLGLRADCPVLRVAAFDPDRSLRAHALWEPEALLTRYAELEAQLDASTARLPELSPADAMVESFLVGGRALRQLVGDPRLPAPILAEGALARLVDRVRRYDRLGREAWAPFLAAHGAPHRSARAPVDFSPLEPAARALTPVEMQ